MLLAGSTHLKNTITDVSWQARKEILPVSAPNTKKPPARAGQGSFAVFCGAGAQSSTLRRPMTSDTGSEKQMAPALVPAPVVLLMADMMAAFCPAGATM